MQKPPSVQPPISFADAFSVWLRVAALSFGGPAAQIAVMHRIVVEEKQWISEARFLHALNYCMLLPGPEAQQLATYLGWLMHRTAGGLMAGLLFIAPGFVAILALSVIYMEFGQTSWLSAIFFGLKAAVLAVVIEAMLRIAKRTLRSQALVGIAFTAFVAMLFFNIAFPLVILGAGLVGGVASFVRPAWFNLRAPPPAANAHGGALDDAIAANTLPHIKPHGPRAVRTAILWLLVWLMPVALCWLWLGPANVFTTLGTFFSQAALFTFGGAYSVLAYVAQQAVETYSWLSPSEMLDGLAMAETTPGPLIMVLQFVGFLAAARAETGLSPLAAGLIGSVLTVWVTFAPSFMWIFIGAPYVESLQGQRWLNAALSCITAAVVGVILKLAIWFAIHVVFARVDEHTFGPLHIMWPDMNSLDLAALVIAAASCLALLRWHWGVGKTLLAAAVAGLLWKGLLAPL
jgi:chromate transporter